MTTVESTSAGTPAAPLTRVTVLELASVPSAARLYGTVARRTATAVVSRSGPGPRPTLPNTTLVVRGVTPDVEQLTDYQHLFGDTAGDLLPPGFVHVQAFPLHVKLMTFDDFPFAPAGLVHIANVIEQSEPIRLGTPLDVHASVVGLRAHPKGTAFDFITEVHPSSPGDTDSTGPGSTSSGSTSSGSPGSADSGSAVPVWRGISTYLARGKFLSESGSATGDGEFVTVDGSGSETQANASDAEEPVDRLGAGDPLPEYPTALWRLGGDTGRRYASVSGDVNPIHLSWWTARPFGFHHAIAHGMYTAARALAAVPRRPDAPLRWEVSFGSPVYLPTTVAFALTHLPNARPGRAATIGTAENPARGVVWSPRSGRVHLRFSATQG